MGPIANAIKSVISKNDAENNKNDQETTDSTPNPPQEPSDDDENVKLGRSCCGCCCDMRRAVLIMSLIAIVLNAAGIGLNFWNIDETKDDVQSNPNLSDKQKDSDLDQLDSLFRTLTILSCVAIPLLGMAFWGALQFQNRWVIPIAVYMPINLAISISLHYRADSDVDDYDYGVGNVIGSILGVMFAEYAYFSFYREVSSGILTRETYPREEQSCCCV